MAAAAATEGLEPDAAEDLRDAGNRPPSPQPSWPPLDGNRLSLHLYPGGCQRLLHLCAAPHPQLLEVQFLQLSGHEDPSLLAAALAQVAQHLPRLRSLVIKGESMGVLFLPLHSSPNSGLLQGVPAEPAMPISVTVALPAHLGIHHRAGKQGLAAGQI